MARSTFADWAPEQFGGPVLTRVASISAVEANARHINMTSDAYRVPRGNGVSVGVVPKGAAYGESASVNDSVLLEALKVGGVVRIAEEDVADAAQFVNILDTKKLEAASSLARFLDNAVLGTSAAANGGTVPFTSVYRALTQSNAATGYTANANVVRNTTATAVSYDNLSDVVGRVETGSQAGSYDNTVIFAHPSFRTALRGIKDGSGSYVFQGDPSVPGAGSIFGYKVVFTVGATVTATATDTPVATAGGAAGAAGNPLLIVANTDYLLLGDRLGVETLVGDASTGASMLTDEYLLKVRTRKGFAVGYEQAFSVLEKIA